jgi:GTP cyclohydrolase I
MTSHDTATPVSSIETPSESFDTEKARRGARLLLEAMREDPERPALRDTWERRVPDVFETFSEGNREAAKPTMRTFEAEVDDLVIKTGIPLYSFCEHHLLPYHGHLHLAYKPDRAVLGLSKLPRYVRWQTRQPTMQEELTRDVAEGIAAEAGADTVVAQTSATHMCEAMRGVETATETTTTAVVGEPTDAEREWFRAAIGRAEGRQ